MIKYKSIVKKYKVIYERRLFWSKLATTEFQYDTYTYQLSFLDNHHNYIDDDERKSMAIVNLQAILNIEDVDRIIELLEQNNWDETVIKTSHFNQKFIDSSISLLCSSNK